ncbi:hypothetical protein E8K88_14970 [Lampropedia aestuarii]|uniref:Alkaline phytoceramidase n=1 Tax=Lampropedia aestuarii TaxID=2562762 RepID=A0A4S5BNY4_9BURK|nr:hypothetical protein [Lampropedia aestuarii]THJ31458.1 hypothetical protein E8K88_14970 [Lampropedia aestuarii]
MSSYPAFFASPQRAHASPWLLLGWGVLLCLAAALLPALPQAAHYHDFADARTLMGIPYAMDVLSNLPLLLAGLAIAWQLRRFAHTSAQPLPMWGWLLALAALGFAVTALASSIYHWQPDDAGVFWDRLAMGVIFAAVIGLAVGQIYGALTAATAALLTLAAAVLALWIWRKTGNFTPWIVLQAGGMLLLLAIACQPRHSPLRQAAVPLLPLGALIAWYSLAKLAELGDHGVFAVTAGLLSGHSLKHILAALAAWPLLQMLYNAQADLAEPFSVRLAGPAHPCRSV